MTVGPKGLFKQAVFYVKIDNEWALRNYDLLTLSCYINGVPWERRTNIRGINARRRSLQISASTSLSSGRFWVRTPSILGTSAPDFLSGFTPLAFPFIKKVSRKTAVCFLLGLSPLALPFNKKVFHRTVDYWFCSGVSPLSLSPPKGIPQGSGDSWGLVSTGYYHIGSRQKACPHSQTRQKK